MEPRCRGENSERYSKRRTLLQAIKHLEQELERVEAKNEAMWKVELEIGASSLPAIQEYRDKLYAALSDD